jgi:hypothetical protein
MTETLDANESAFLNRANSFMQNASAPSLSVFDDPMFNNLHTIARNALDNPSTLTRNSLMNIHMPAQSTSFNVSSSPAPPASMHASSSVSSNSDYMNMLTHSSPFAMQQFAPSSPIELPFVPNSFSGSSFEIQARAALTSKQSVLLTLLFSISQVAGGYFAYQYLRKLIDQKLFSGLWHEASPSKSAQCLTSLPHSNFEKTSQVTETKMIDNSDEDDFLHVSNYTVGEHKTAISGGHLHAIDSATPCAVSQSASNSEHMQQFRTAEISKYRIAWILRCLTASCIPSLLAVLVIAYRKLKLMLHDHQRRNSPNLADDSLSIHSRVLLHCIQQLVLFNIGNLANIFKSTSANALTLYPTSTAMLIISQLSMWVGATRTTVGYSFPGLFMSSICTFMPFVAYIMQEIAK